MASDSRCTDVSASGPLCHVCEQLIGFWRRQYLPDPTLARVEDPVLQRVGHILPDAIFRWPERDEGHSSLRPEGRQYFGLHPSTGRERRARNNWLYPVSRTRCTLMPTD